MTKHEFLERLDLLLTDLPQEERMDAIWYYEDYFADAGPENEEQVLKELGSPESVAEKIRTGWKQTETGYGEETGWKQAETGYGEETGWKQTETRYGEEAGKTENGYGETPFGETSVPRWEAHRKSSLKPLLALFAFVFLGIPIVMPILFSLFIAFFVFALVFGIGGVAMVAAGVALIGSGMANMAFGTGIAMMCIGAGLIVAAIGILFIVFAVNCAFRAIPSIIRGCVSLARRLLFGKEARYETI